MSGLLTATAAGAARLGRLVAAACCAALCAGAIGGAGPADDWRHKVDPEVAAPGEAPREFLVVLGEQADLSGACRLATHAQKTAWVHRRLRETAARTQAPVVEALRAAGAEVQPFWIANFIWASGGRRAVEVAAARPDVALVEANPPVAPALPVPEARRAEKSLDIPWGILKTRAPEAWAAGARGQGAVVAGADTGYDWNHPALIRQYRGWDGAAATHDHNWHDAVHAAGSSCGADAPEPCDDNGHGTHTMGTMAGDDGAGAVVGMAPAAAWIGCRNMNAGWGTPATYMECLQWFVAPTDGAGQDPDPARAPHVINNSYSCTASEGCGDPAALLLAVENVRAAGIFMAVSAGNSGPACGSVYDPPAIYDAAFTVGSVDGNDVAASSSSRGPVTRDGSNRLKPDIAAPGVSVTSCLPGTGYGVMSGTSMAAPHVAGLVALVISANPDTAGDVDWLEALIARSAVGLTNAQNCGDFAGADIPNAVYGHGRIDALAAVVAARSDLDRDGRLTAADPPLLARSLAGNPTTPAVGRSSGDRDGDGRPTAADLLRLRLDLAK